MSEGLVGGARIAGLDLVVEPRIPVARVLWLLGYSCRWPELKEAAPLDPAADLLHAFAELYLRALRRALRRGVQMGYRLVEEQMMGVRGQLRLVDQARRHFGQVVPAEVSYDDYTADTDANRILKAALRRLERAPLRDARLRRRVAASVGALEIVTDIRFDPRRLPAVPITRLNPHYEPPLALAEVVLRSGSVEIHPGRTRVPGLMFKMWQIYEDFLYEALRSHFEPPVRLCHGEQIHLDDASRIDLIPDLTLWNGGDCVWVGDAKYKRTVIGEQADIYQLLAYCAATGLDRGSLVYADGHAGAHHRVRLGGPLLEVRGLDLAAAPTEIEAQVTQLAEAIKISSESPGPTHH